MVANVNLSKRQSIEIIIDVNKKVQILSTGNSFHDILFVNLKSSFHFVFVLKCRKNWGGGENYGVEEIFLRNC